MLNLCRNYLNDLLLIIGCNPFKKLTCNSPPTIKITTLNIPPNELNIIHLKEFLVLLPQPHIRYHNWASNLLYHSLTNVIISWCILELTVVKNVITQIMLFLHTSATVYVSATFVISRHQFLSPKSWKKFRYQRLPTMTQTTVSNPRILIPKSLYFI